VPARSPNENEDVPSIAALLEPVFSLLEPIAFQAGVVLFREGDPTDSFFLIDSGEVRLEVHSDEIDSDATLAFLGPGSMLGEIGILTGATRSATAIAHTEVKARRMSKDDIEWLYRERPTEGLALARVLGQAAAWRVRSIHEQHEERLDRLLHDIASTIAGRGEELAAATIAETGIGVADDQGREDRLRLARRLLHARRAARDWPPRRRYRAGGRRLRQPGRRRVRHDTGNRARLDVHQQGPHRPQGSQRRDHQSPSSLGGDCGADRRHRPRRATAPGTRPCGSARMPSSTMSPPCVVASKSFDNGLICGAEQHLIVDISTRDALAAALESAGAVVLDRVATEQFVATAFLPTGRLRATFIGQSASAIAAAAGVPASDDTRLIVITGQVDAVEGAYATGRLAPIVTLYATDGDDAAIDLCRALLAHEGTGHTAVIHSDDEGRIDRFARAMPASRILAGVPASQGCGGALTGLVPSMTLGGGTFGGTATTDNVGYRNLLNVKRLARMNFTNAINARRLSEA
jgi:CRP-like cAMP-binding protein